MTPLETLYTPAVRRRFRASQNRRRELRKARAVAALSTLAGLLMLAGNLA